MIIRRSLPLLFAMASVAVAVSAEAQPYVYVAARPASDYTVDKVDARTAQVVSTWSLSTPTYSLQNFIVDPMGQSAYYTTDSHDVWRLDFTTGVNQLLAAEVGYINNSLTISPDGMRIHLIRWSGTGSLRVLNASTGGQIADVPLATLPHTWAVSPVTGRIYLALNNGVTVLDGTTYAQVGRIDLTGINRSPRQPWAGDTPIYLAVSPDGAHLYASLQLRIVEVSPTHQLSPLDTTGLPSIVDIDLATNSVAGTIDGIGEARRAVFAGSKAYALTTRGGYVWNQMSVIDITSRAFVVDLPTTGVTAYELAVTSDARSLAVSDSSPLVEIRDLASGATTPVTGISGYVVGMDAPSACAPPVPAEGWGCLNGGWVPPGWVPASTPSTDSGGSGGGTGAGGSGTGGEPGAGSCTTAMPAAGWVCVNGGWVPPDHPLATSGGAGGGTSGGTGGGSTGSTACTPTMPASGWVCVNGGWVPPDHPLATSGGSTGGTSGGTSGGSTGGSTACTTVRPATDWVCVNGGWVPPDHPLARDGG